MHTGGPGYCLVHVILAAAPARHYLHQQHDRTILLLALRRHTMEMTHPALPPHVILNNESHPRDRRERRPPRGLAPPAAGGADELAVAEGDAVHGRRFDGAVAGEQTSKACALQDSQTSSHVK